MKNIKKIEKVESKPDVNISFRKPYVFNGESQQKREEENNFPTLLDESIEQLRNQDGKTFDETVQDVIDGKEESLSREYQTMLLKKARRRFELLQSESREIEEKGPRIRH